MFFQHGSPEMFHEGVKNIIKDTYNCLRNNSLRHCLYTPAKSRTGIDVSDKTEQNICASSTIPLIWL
jgi:hypothetical protein